MSEDKNIPTTIAEAVNQLLSDISIEAKHQIKDSNEDGLINFHFGLAKGIRNEFGLWEKDSKLFENCKELAGDSNMDVDTASGLIIKALWDRLQEFPPPKVLRGKGQGVY